MNTDCLSPDTCRGDDPDDPGSQTKGDVRHSNSRPAPNTDSPSGPLSVVSNCLPPRQLAALTSLLQQVIAFLPRDVAHVDIAVLQDDQIIELHQRWHGLDDTTDVLTFEHSTEGPLEASIAVCLDQAIRSTEDREIDVLDELVLYAIHGLLHCCGCDDHTPDQATNMRQHERSILQQLGRGDIFARGEDAS